MHHLQMCSKQGMFSARECQIMPIIKSDILYYTVAEQSLSLDGHMLTL
jgi:hypothetical protein